MKATLLLVLAVALPGCSRQSDLRRPPTEAQMQALNDRLTDAYEREDVGMLREMLSDRHIHNNVFGSRMTKDAFLKDIETGVLVFESYQTPEIEWFIEPEMAVATGVIKAKAIRDGKPVPADTFRFTRVFAREANEWKVLLFQNTMSPGVGNAAPDNGSSPD